MKKTASANCYKWIALAIVWGAVFFQQGVRQIVSEGGVICIVVHDFF